MKSCVTYVCFAVICGSRQTVSSHRAARCLHLAVVATTNNMAPSDMSGVFQRSEINFDGYWGKPTSTIDWCEANYEVSFYIAEFCKYWQCRGEVISVRFHFVLLDRRRRHCACVLKTDTSQRLASVCTGAWVLPPAFDVINNVVLIL